jgi:hypothetical protein
MADDERADATPLPKLPVRAAIYILPDGQVAFGALFDELQPVARALGGPATPPLPLDENAATTTASVDPAPARRDEP